MDGGVATVLVCLGQRGIPQRWQKITSRNYSGQCPRSLRLHNDSTWDKISRSHPSLRALILLWYHIVRDLVPLFSIKHFVQNVIQLFCCESDKASPLFLLLFYHRISAAFASLNYFSLLLRDLEIIRLTLVQCYCDLCSVVHVSCPSVWSFQQGWCGGIALFICTFFVGVGLVWVGGSSPPPFS